MTDDDLRRVLTQARVTAVVGFSVNPARPSHYVSVFLQSQGYRVIPVNPGLAGQEHLGEVAVASLKDIAEPVDMVDIFRRSDAVGPVVEEALEHLPGLTSIWMQLGVIHQAAADMARAQGLDVVMDRCPKIEIPRLGLLKTA